MRAWKISVTGWLAAAGVCMAQPRTDTGWLMQNYRFAGPPPPSESVTPVIAQLQEIQNTTLSILRKADFEGDWEAALAAAAQAAANAQMIQKFSQELKRGSTPPSNPHPEAGPANYRIAFLDRHVESANAVWCDRLMVHYTTWEGAHVQVRLGLIDWKRTAGLNRP